MGTAIQPGAVIDGKYRVIRRIGEGGMGTVYEGENVRIERRVAIKVLHEHVASSPEFAQRFEREARASARIGSAHVCDVLDLGDLSNGERFIVMEYLDGESLEARLDRGLMTAQDLAPIAFEILEGLGSMHQVGVVHRDLKPANIFLSKKAGALRQTGRGRTEMVKILDFGVAKILARADDPKEMTSTGMMMGTPLYMSPEQARGARDVDGRTDIYAASVIFYRALTGELPHSGLNLHELLFKIVLEEPRPIRDRVPSADPVFAALVHKGLARDAEHRYNSARSYQEAIAEWGKTQNRETLRFEITLPEEDPPLRNISGGFPTARIQLAAGARPEGPPTPQDVATRAHGRPNTPVGVTPGGTPIVWSDDAPEAAKRAFAELEKQKLAGHTPGVLGVPHAPTLNSSTRMMPSMHGDTPPPHMHGMGAPVSVPVVVPMKTNIALRIALVVGAIFAIVVAVGAARFLAGVAGGGPTSPSASVASTSPPPPDSHALGNTPPPTPVPSDDVPPPVLPSSVAVASVTPPTASPPPVFPPRHSTPHPPPVSSSVAHTQPSAPPPPPPASTAATPPPTPTATGSGRKFRTNL